MADVWISALNVVMRSGWTPELKQKVGETVLEAMFMRIQENHELPKEDLKAMDSAKFVEYMAKPNSHHNNTITVGSN